MTLNVDRVDAARCQNLDKARRLEWIVTNGRGGYAMAGVTGLLSRRYHGLLVAAIKAPIERFVLLAKLEVTALVGGLTYELSTNDYPEAVHPRGYKLLESFAARPYPTWRWRLGDTVLEQTLCMGADEDTTHVRFRVVDGKQTVTLQVRPMCTSRHYHTLTTRHTMPAPQADAKGDTIELRWSDDRPIWRLSHNGDFKNAPDWYYDYVMTVEAERGQDWLQDLYTPGVISATLTARPGSDLTVTATAGARTWRDAVAAFDAALQRAAAPAMHLPGAAPEPTPIPVEGKSSPGKSRKSGKTAATHGKSAVVIPGEQDPLLAPLARAAAEFLVRRGDGSRTVIAGYPWFEDWGRDTFISLPGLCLVTGRHAEARAIIEGFATYVDQGMIPNRFPPFGQPPAYNTADASLWYIHAIDRYLAYTGDWAFVSDRMYAVVAAILEAHERGTRHGIGARDDGLLAAGTPGEQLTWMDAKVGDWVVTPRIGKPVEINALWYESLSIGADYATRLGDRTRAARWQALAERCRTSFNERFWNESRNCLFDIVDVDHVPGKNDALLRPNQIFAVSLTRPVLDERRWAAVVESCAQRLLTPIGLRTLAPGESGYCPRYAGDMRARDGAYHQGTVWPWLLGPFVTASVRVGGGSPEVRGQTRRCLDGLEAHLGEAGVCGVSEVADAEPPHQPGGCPWQAWSVAEPLRALCEDILQVCPTRRESAPHVRTNDGSRGGMRANVAH